MLNIILFGRPGAGKSTQSNFLIQEYGLYHISPGNILRQEVHIQSNLGKKVATYINKGLLAPHDLVVAVVEKRMKSVENAKKGFLFDGYPRSYRQALALDNQLAQLYKNNVSLAIVLDVDEEESKKRIQIRKKLFNRIDDQHLQTITTRMETYQAVALPLFDFYNKQKKIVNIVGKGDVYQVKIRVKEAINRHCSS